MPTIVSCPICDKLHEVEFRGNTIYCYCDCNDIRIDISISGRYRPEKSQFVQSPVSKHFQ